eukprot:1643127-Amphidinium_carterae.1
MYPRLVPRWIGMHLVRSPLYSHSRCKPLVAPASLASVRRAACSSLLCDPLGRYPGRSQSGGRRMVYEPLRAFTGWLADCHPKELGGVICEAVAAMPADGVAKCEAAASKGIWCHEHPDCWDGWEVVAQQDSHLYRESVVWIPGGVPLTILKDFFPQAKRKWILRKTHGTATLQSVQWAEGGRRYRPPFLSRPQAPLFWGDV